MKRTRHRGIVELATNRYEIRAHAVDPRVVRSIVGHATAAMTEHYSHVDLGEKRAAVGRMLQLVRPAKSGVESGGEKNERSTKDQKSE